MIKPRLVLSSLVVLLATGGAVASKITHRTTTVYYTNAQQTCSTTTIDKTCSTGASGCTKNVGGSLGNVQLFQTVNAQDQCINELKEGL